MIIQQLFLNKGNVVSLYLPCTRSIFSSGIRHYDLPLEVRVLISFDFYCSLREVPGTTKYDLSILRPDRSHRILLRASRISMKGPKATSCLFTHPNPPSASPKSASAASQRGTSNTSRYLQGQRISPRLQGTRWKNSCTPRHHLNSHQCNVVPFHRVQSELDSTLE